MDAPRRSSPTRTLPGQPELSRIRKQAKLLLKQFRASDVEATSEVSTHYHDADPGALRLCDAQLVIARAYGFSSWPKLAAHVRSKEVTADQDPRHYKDVFRAIEEGNTQKVLSLIDVDESLLDVADHNQSTPLTRAFAFNNLELAGLLIERGANAFAMNHSEKWAMRSVVERSGLRREDRERLVETAIAARVWDAEIFHAVWRRDRNLAEKVLKDDPAQVSIRLAVLDAADGFWNTLPYCGLSPLHYAVIAGDLRMVRLLLERGAEVDALPHAHEADSRFTPMYYVPSGCGPIAERLVEHGANVKHTKWYLTSGSKAMRKVVVAHGAAGTPLLAALCVGDLNKAIDIARQDPTVIHDRLKEAYIDTPLHMAMKAGCAELVEILLDHGMDVDTPSSRGYTPLTMAPELYCSLDMIKLLVERGADVHAGMSASGSGFLSHDAALHSAIWQHAYEHWDYEAVIRYLVRIGSRPCGLYHCALGGNLAAAKLLVELGADVNETDDKGRTALDYCTGAAAEHEHPDIAEFLRQHGGRHAEELVGP